MSVPRLDKPLCECLSLVIDHRGKTPKKLGGDWVASGIPAISAKNVNGGRLVAAEDIRYVTEEMYRRWMKEDVQRGDCLLVSEGATLGECMLWDEDYPIVLSQRIFCLRPNPEILYPRYLYAFMTTPSFQAEVKGRATGSSVDGLRQGEVLKLNIALPPLEEQREIGDTLYSLNKKIDLNRRMNGTLEALAQAVFKEWFVEKAKKAVCTKKVGELAQLIMGQSPKGDTYNDAGAGLPLLNGAGDFVNGFPEVTRYTTDPLRTSQAGDVVFTMRGTIGNLCLGDRDYAMGRCVSALRPHKATALWPVYFSIERSLEDLKSQALGSVITGLTKEDIARVEVPMLEPADLVEFHALVNPMMERREHNRIESRTLTALRDTLLPKLMRGEVRVKQTVPV